MATGRLTTRPFARGVGLAALAALLFGATAPLLQLASRGLNPVAAAAFLYLGAGVLALVIKLGRDGRSGSRPPGSRPSGALQEAALTRADLPRVLLVALLGGFAGPALLVLGLRSTDAVRASLLLTLEAPLTALFAAALFGEYVSRRVWLAVTFITIGAATLAYPALSHDAIPGLHHQETGDVFVVLACVAWALDNSVSRKLADRDPLAVVAAKGLCGAALSLSVAFAAGWIRWLTIGSGAALRLMVVGAVGYGLSLQLYLRAQRMVGAARTASVFAAAPFVGVAVAILLGTPSPGGIVALSAALMAVGIGLHATERHRHAHAHRALDHEHVHVHDDGHHGHHHDPMPLGPHCHPHHHEPVTHHHEHSEDVHHHHVH
jgi:drug/metabolite transporter (DMT)-like permease